MVSAGQRRLSGAAVQFALPRRRLLAGRVSVEALPVGLQMRELGQLAALGQQIHQEGVQDVGTGEATPTRYWRVASTSLR